MNTHTPLLQPLPQGRYTPEREAEPAVWTGGAERGVEAEAGNKVGSMGCLILWRSTWDWCRGSWPSAVDREASGDWTRERTEPKQGPLFLPFDTGFPGNPGWLRLTLNS